MKLIKWLIIIVFVTGLVLMGVGIAYGGSFDDVVDTVSSGDDYVLQDPITYEDPLTQLIIDVAIRDISIQTTEDEHITIEHYRRDNEDWSITFEDGVLLITQESRRIFSFDWTWLWSSNHRMDLIIKIPSTYEFDIHANTDTGRIELSGFQSLGDVLLETNTGKIEVEEIDATKLNLYTDTGSIYLDEADVLEDIDIDTDTGSVHVDHTSSNSIVVEVSTGSINLTDVEINQVDLKSNTGSIEVSGIDLTNRTLRLSTDTGNVKVNGDSKSDDYNLILSDSSFYIDADTDTGNVRIDE